MKKRYVYLIIILLIIFVFMLLSKNLILKSYILNKVNKATLSNVFNRECFLDNDLQVIEYVKNDIVVYEYYDEDGIKKDIIDLEDFNSKKIYSIDTTINTITNTRDFTEDAEEKEIIFNQNKTISESIKNSKIIDVKFNTLKKNKYLIFQTYQKENSSYEIIFLNLNTNFIEKDIMIFETKDSYTSVVRDYNIITEDNSSNIDIYEKVIEGL